jgi:hypothetical protein
MSDMFSLQMIAIRGEFTMKVLENVKQFIFGSIVFMSFFAVHSNFMKDSMEAKQYVQNKVQTEINSKSQDLLPLVTEEESILAMNDNLDNKRI